MAASFIDNITVLILTCNEEANIARTLRSVSWARRIVVIDSASTDRTHQDLARFDNVVCHVRRFDSHAAQWNFGLSCCTNSEWLLVLDADHIVTPELAKELGCLDPPPKVSGYKAKFQYCISGRPIRSSVYPAATVLFRRSRGHFFQQGHTQRLRLDGQVGELHHKLLHDDRKPWSRWLAAQRRYAHLEAIYLHTQPMHALRITGRLRRYLIAPLLILPYLLLARRGLFDGPPGWRYAVERTVAECLICREICRQRHSTRTRMRSPPAANNALR